MRKIVLLKIILGALLLTSCGGSIESENKLPASDDSVKKVGSESKESVTAVSNKNYRTEVFEKSGTKSFGYDIFEGETKLIHQEIIPGLSGNNGFRSKEDAASVGNLMVFKLKNGIFPPSVTPEEIDSLGVKIN